MQTPKRGRSGHECLKLSGGKIPQSGLATMVQVKSFDRGKNRLSYLLFAHQGFSIETLLLEGGPKRFYERVDIQGNTSKDTEPC
jgi:hypothetical protein